LSQDLYRVGTEIAAFESIVGRGNWEMHCKAGRIYWVGDVGGTKVGSSRGLLNMGEQRTIRVEES
jgi:hypothetical protein